MQIKLPVDVHLAVGNDGKMILLIGGLMKSVKPDELRDVLSEKQMKQRGKRAAEEAPALTKNGKKLGRPRKDAKQKPAKAKANAASSNSVQRRLANGTCAWCDNKPAKGKKLCANHLVGARKAAEAARVAKACSPKKAA